MLPETDRASALVNLKKAGRKDAVALTAWAMALASELGGASRVEASAGGRWLDPEVSIDFHDPAHATRAAESLGLIADRGSSVDRQSRFVGLVDGIRVVTWGASMAASA